VVGDERVAQCHRRAVHLGNHTVPSRRLALHHRTSTMGIELVRRTQRDVARLRARGLVLLLRRVLRGDCRGELGAHLAYALWLQASEPDIMVDLSIDVGALMVDLPIDVGALMVDLPIDVGAVIVDYTN